MELVNIFKIYSQNMHQSSRLSNAAHFCIAAIVATLKISEDEQPLERS